MTGEKPQVGLAKGCDKSLPVVGHSGCQLNVYMQLKIKPTAQQVERRVACPGACQSKDHFRATLPIFWVSLLLYLRGPDQLLLTFISLPIKGEINQESPHNLLRDAGNTRTYMHTEEVGHMRTCINTHITACACVCTYSLT